MKLKELALKHKAKKYEWYIDTYELILGKLEPKTMLEIGVAYGGSARMWQEYFQQSASQSLQRSACHTEFPFDRDANNEGLRIEPEGDANSHRSRSSSPQSSEEYAPPNVARLR